MKTLFPLQGNFRIVKLQESDVYGDTDHLKTFENLVLANEDMYPGIERWLKDKVIPGLKSTERVAYVGYEGEMPIVSAVLKRGEKAKFCHLRIHNDFQDADLGQVFFSQMALEVRHHAKEIHFTLPESLWLSKHQFFSSFGFEVAKKATRQYRKGEPELRCSAPYASVMAAALDKLPHLIEKFSIGGYSLNNRLLMSIKPSHAQKILRGEKVIEIRRKFSKRWLGHGIVLYASLPVGALVGEGSIKNIVAGEPEEMWARLGAHIGCTRDAFIEYTRLAKRVYAIELEDIVPYLERIPLNQVSHLLREDLKPPQSYLALGGNKTWTKAVSIAAFLHGSVRTEITKSARENREDVPIGPYAHI